MDVIQIINNYIHPTMLSSVIALWFIGYALKKTPKIPDWSIVYITIIIGVVFGGLLVGPNVNGVIQGILAAALAVLGHQTVKQTTQAIEEIKDNK